MRRAVFILLLLVASTTACWGDARAQRIGLTNLVIDNHEGRVKVRFGVDIQGEDIVRGALEKGEVLALECKARLSQKRTYAWNSSVSKATLLSQLILHDGGPYEILHPGTSREHYRGRSLPLLMKEAWGAMSMDLGGWDQLSRGNAYSLTLEIRLVRQDVSSFLKGALFFWNFDAIPPAIYQLDFSY
ncbi:MAG: DUF4390 domain-containing protein [Desulfovibrio sp.]|nr:DUF4390 domain-containing protein [Desulfovibrio sp.]MBI4959988.1 DUF4390 domain-containing protein [Desulfovibrio sp.]